MTKHDRKSDRFTSITRGLILVFLVQVFLGVLSVLLALSLSAYLDLAPGIILENSYFNIYVSLYTSIIMLIITILFSTYVENRSLKSLGFHKKNFKKYILQGSLTGGLLAITILLFNWLFQSLTVTLQPDQRIIHFILLFFGYIIYAASEEFFYRGYLMNALSVDGDITQAMTINSLIFGIVSALATQFSVVHFINSFLFGMILSYIFYLSDNILTSLFANASWHIVFNLILGSSTHSEAAPPYSLFKMTVFDSSSQISLSGTLYSTFVLVLILFGIHVWTQASQKDTL